MNPNPGPDYGKLVELEKMLGKGEVQYADGSTFVKPKAEEVQTQDWPRLQVGEKLTWKGHVWRVTELWVSGHVVIKAERPADG